MIRRMMMLVPAVLAGAGLAAIAGAQNNTLIIYGSDACPANTICVRAPESERYRIPKPFRGGPLPNSERPWSQRAAGVASAGASGTGSCSNTGGGGWTGCWSQMMRDAKQEKRAAAAEVANSPVPKP